MIHPHTEVRIVNPTIGYGVFATAFIPAGTIVYAKDAMEIEVPPDHPLLQDPEYAEHIHKYSYIDPRGMRIISWDIGKYVNHSCDRNTMSTGYGFEIALRDIQPGEQITDEYGIFNIEFQFTCGCEASNCRGTIRHDDLDRYALEWDRLIKPALARLPGVEQPLLPYVDEPTRRALDRYLTTGRDYRSVARLKYQPKARTPRSRSEVWVAAK